jgi:hypothetical protein
MKNVAISKKAKARPKAALASIFLTKERIQEPPTTPPTTRTRPVPSNSKEATTHNKDCSRISFSRYEE